jgi:uncharacterized protein YbjT (DUF2867 family)
LLVIVVTGATGNVGRSLVQILAAAGRPVTATSRAIEATDAPEGVRHIRADLTQPDSLRPVFDSAEALFLQNGGPSAHHLSAPDILDAAKSAGIRRVVLLSSQGAATRPESVSHGGIARSIEDAVEQSGLDWTILRPGGFASNAYAWAESVRTRRVIAAPFADVGLPVVDPADIAEVAAVALREDGHEGRTYELTGPALSTPRQRARTIADALGEPVRFDDQTREEARTQMLRFMPEPVADTTLDILGDPTPAEQRISPDIERILSRPPRTFADWTHDHIAAFR